MKRRMVAVLLIFVLSGAGLARAEEGGDQRYGFVDLIFWPAEAVLSRVFDLGEIVVTPGRTREYIFNINKNVSVISDEDIQRSNPRYLQQMIARGSGVVLSGYFGNARDSSVDMRGFGEAGLLNYLVLIDGRRTNQIDMSGADLSQIDLNAIDRIEIIRGANSVLYGDNATGGVINIITKTGTPGDHVEYTQRFGSYQYHKEYVSVNGGHDLLDYFFSYAHQDSDGYRLNNAFEADDIFSSLTIKPAGFLDIHLSSGYHRDWYGQPGALYPVNIQNDGREGSRFPDSKAKTEDYYFTLDPRISGESGGHEGVLSLFISYRSRRTNALSVSFSEYETNHHIASLDFKPQCEINSSFFDDSLQNKLVFGADYFYARDRVLSGDRTFTKSQLDIIKRTFGIYASDNMLAAGRFILNGGVRGEWAGYVFDQFQPAAAYNTRSPREIAFDAGLGYKYGERSQVYANFARSYRYPATDEFFQSAYEYLDWWTGAVTVFPAVLNTDLKHQTGNNYEIGIKDNSFDLVKLNASYYLMDNRNEIYYDPATYENSNYHHTVHHGLELEAHADVFERISV
ncbi:MAG: TonB-dependent receptor, partial [Candidatus Omnitrophica bacterium]|nr:TonB-dependent receptor [Candidatus Omnitrophota bacterium]